jgi:hypothetical protein
MRIVQTLIPAVLAAALLAACDTTAPAPGGRDTEPAQPVADPKQPVAVTVDPPAVTVTAGESVAFSASVTGSPDVSVVWDVVEEGGGSVGATGLYTAPPSAGTYRVRAAASAEPQVFGESIVTVRPPVAVAVAPATATVVAGGTLTFTAAVANATNGAVIWSVAGASCGAITPAGVYTAPPSPATCSVVARSQEDSTRLASATVQVIAPVTVVVSPYPAAANTCRTVTFTASVAGATDRSVTWSVQEGSAGGTITSAGVYTAPAQAGTYHVVATSRADPTKRSISSVAVTDRIVSVAVSPAQVSVAPGRTAQFTATVTTTCGTFSSTRTLTAPGG